MMVGRGMPFPSFTALSYGGSHELQHLRRRPELVAGTQPYSGGWAFRDFKPIASPSPEVNWRNTSLIAVCRSQALR